MPVLGEASKVTLKCRKWQIWSLDVAIATVAMATVTNKYGFESTCSQVQWQVIIVSVRAILFSNTRPNAARVITPSSGVSSSPGGHWCIHRRVTPGQNLSLGMNFLLAEYNWKIINDKRLNTFCNRYPDLCKTKPKYGGLSRISLLSTSLLIAA